MSSRALRKELVLYLGVAHQVAHHPGTTEASRANLHVLLLHDVRPKTTGYKATLLQKKLYHSEHPFFMPVREMADKAKNAAKALEQVLLWLADSQNDCTPDICELHQTQRYHCSQTVKLYVARLYRDHWQWWANEYWHEIRTLRTRLYKERRKRQRQQ